MTGKTHAQPMSVSASCTPHQPSQRRVITSIVSSTAPACGTSIISLLRARIARVHACCHLPFSTATSLHCLMTAEARRWDTVHTPAATRCCKAAAVTSSPPIRHRSTSLLSSQLIRCPRLLLPKPAPAVPLVNRLLVRPLCSSCVQQWLSAPSFFSSS
jgi:hypothetical protein